MTGQHFFGRLIEIDQTRVPIRLSIPQGEEMGTALPSSPQARTDTLDGIERTRTVPQ